MLLRTNLTGIISTLERYQGGLAEAVRRATAPDERWKNFLRHRAELALAALAGDDLTQVAAIPDLVNTLTGFVAGGRTIFQMMLASPTAVGAGFPVDVERARRTALGEGDAGGEFVSAEDNLTAVKEAVREWVMTEKVLDETEHADPDVAVDAMMEILGFAPNRQNVYTPEMAQAASQIAPHIQDFINRRAELTGAPRATGLDAATTRQWATAVLLTWRATVPDELFHRLRQELNRTRQQVQRGELLLP